jgi:hypothetical protein
MVCSRFVLRTPKYINPENFIPIGRGQHSNYTKIHHSIRFLHFLHSKIVGFSMPLNSKLYLLGLGTSKKSVNASIILAGDPKQLGPVILSQLGESLGLDQSYLERLTELEIYRKNSVTGKFDPTLITKLKKNYRSHPMLIDLSNRLFYDGEIEACGDKGSLAYQSSVCEMY